MEGLNSASTTLRKSNSSNNRSEGAPSSDSDSPSPTRSGASGERRTMLSEVYGFMGSITVVVAAGLIATAHTHAHVVPPLKLFPNWKLNDFSSAIIINYSNKTLLNLLNFKEPSFIHALIAYAFLSR